METGDDRRGNGQAAQDVVILTKDELERLVNPLSVVHGYTQLLQRRLRQGQLIDRAELFRTLDAIENASRTIKAQLDTLSSLTDLCAPDSDSE